MQARWHISIFTLAIILASVIYTATLLKTDLDVVQQSKSSLALQELNANELSASLGNIQLNINRYILFRRQSSLDSLEMFKKAFLAQVDTLCEISDNIPEIRKYGRAIYINFPKALKQQENNFEVLPQQITLQNIAGIFNRNGDPFSVIWIAINHVRSYQINTIKRSTKETIAAGSRAWNVSTIGSIFMFLVILGSYFYIRIIYKKQALLKSKELDSEAKRKENEKLLQAVIDNSTSLIFLKDKNSRYTLVNKSFRQVLNLETEKILGKTHEEVVSAINPEHVIADEIEILSDGKIQESIEIINGKDKIRHFLTAKFPLYGANGEIFGLGGISTDITDQREYENELMQAREQAEAAKISQQRFLANMSHEIRTPMNGVIGMTNLLDSTSLDAEQQDYVNVIRQSSDILMLLINDILDVSKMQAGMLKLEKIPFEVRESIRQIFLSYKPMAAEMGIELICNVDEIVPEFLSGDPLRLNQIISNLVNNAIKFTSSGSVTIKVTAIEENSNLFKLKVDVTDTGIGIPANKLENIFESFTQSSTSTTRKYGGTGLGLAIVKELVEMQGGNVYLSSELNMGSTFTIIIPFALATVDKTERQKSKETQKFASLKNKKVLVVEDNLINQKVARQILLKAGLATVDVADNGFKALDLLKINVYDAVLMDVQMPEIDGLETTRRIRNELNLNVPVIALTASALLEDREICFAAGMNDYITKPFLPDDLLRKLSALV